MTWAEAFSNAAEYFSGAVVMCAVFWALTRI